MSGCLVATNILILLTTLSCYWLHFVEADGLCWTNWINRYASTEGNDQEILDYNAMSTYGVCLRPYAVDFVRVDGAPSNTNIKCYYNGCKCRSADQPSGTECGDYKVRFLCPCPKVTRYLMSDGNYLRCNGEKTLNVKCPTGGVIKVTSVFHGIIWFSRCGIASLGSSCPNTNNKSLFAAVSNICDGHSNCSLDLNNILDSNSLPDGCNVVTPKQFHVEVQCRRDCSYRGKIIRTGSVFHINNCNEKCHCLHNGQIVCHPLCPRLQFNNCTRVGVVRLASVPAPDFPDCRCYQALCDLPTKTGCFYHSKRYKTGQSFHINCKYNCQCLPSGKIKCQQLCPPSKEAADCMAGTVEETIAMATVYPGCQCERSVCRSNN